MIGRAFSHNVPHCAYLANGDFGCNRIGTATIREGFAGATRELNLVNDIIGGTTHIRLTRDTDTLTTFVRTDQVATDTKLVLPSRFWIEMGDLEYSAGFRSNNPTSTTTLQAFFKALDRTLGSTLGSGNSINIHSRKPVPGTPTIMIDNQSSSTTVKRTIR